MSHGRMLRRGACMPHDNEDEFVPQATANEIWAGAAYDTLRETAKSYNRLITYKEIAQTVQSTSGITTKQRLHYWIGPVLETVAAEASSRGEPPLTALCVHENGTMGDSYLRAPKSVPHEDDVDVERLAAEHRLLCYREYATDLPEHRGFATLTPQVAQKRARLRKSDPPNRPMCPIHHCEISATGLCGSCD